MLFHLFPHLGFDDISPRLTILRFSFSHPCRTGLERNDFYITYEPVGHMLRTSRGITPRNNFLLDQFWGVIGSVRSVFFAFLPLEVSDEELRADRVPGLEVHELGWGDLEGEEEVGEGGGG